MCLCVYMCVCVTSVPISAACSWGAQLTFNVPMFSIIYARRDQKKKTLLFANIYITAEHSGYYHVTSYFDTIDDTAINYNDFRVVTTVF